MTQELSNTALYILSTAIGVIGVLLMLIYNLGRTEALRTQRSLDEKASLEALKEAKVHFRETLTKYCIDYRDSLEKLAAKQDREIDWLKEEVNKVSANLCEMRREAIAANQAIMIRLDQVLSNERRHQS